MKETLFMRQLNAYFEIHLPETRRLRPDTIAAYADSFALLFQFLQEQKGLPHYRVNYKDFTPAMLDDYVHWMGHAKHYSASSKKQRISAIRAFLKYASRREMAALSALSAAVGTETPRVPRSAFPYFTLEETHILFRQPDANKKTGRRDMVLLSLLYESAARAQELCDLCVESVRFGTPTKVKLVGKNSKVREVPISEEVARLLRWHLKQNGLESKRGHPLFSSQTKEKMTPACIRSLTEKYVEQAKMAHPKLFPEPKYSPHSFRHSKAVHMVESGTQLIYIRNFLGHSSIQSTEIYARVGQAAVAKALSNRKIPNAAPEDVPPSRTQSPVPEFISKARKHKIM
jgi:site-specific recombinase XerD